VVSVGGVAVPVVQVVDMVVVRDGDVAAAEPMLVPVLPMRHVSDHRALVDVVSVDDVEVPVVQEVHMVVVRDRHMPAPLAVDVRMPAVRSMPGRCRHGRPPR